MVIKSFCTSTPTTPLICRDSITRTVARTRRVRYGSWRYVSTYTDTYGPLLWCSSENSLHSLHYSNRKSFIRLYSTSSSSSESSTSRNDCNTQRIHSDDNQYNDPTGTIQKVRQSLMYDILPSIFPPLPFYNSDGTYHPHPVTPIENIDSRNNSMTDITVLLGVSGGCDSVALLHILHELLLSSAVGHDLTKFNSKNNIHWNLIVVHFDHQQRGVESDQDRIMVETLCQKFQLPCFTFYWSDSNLVDYSNKNNTNNHTAGNELIANTDTSSIPRTLTAATKKIFSQDLARKWRRRVMQELVAEQVMKRKQQCTNNIGSDNTGRRTSHIGMIMTAHHKDDSEETILLKLLRGVHITNIAGLLMVRRCTNYDTVVQDTILLAEYDGEEESSRVNMETNRIDKNEDVISGLYWVRPLLHLRKHELLEYLQNNNIIWRDDVSNQSNKYLRNRVRNELVPLLHDLLQGEEKATHDSAKNESSYSIGKTILERRLVNLQHQASDIRNDLDTRVQSLLMDSAKDGVFLLPSPKQIVKTHTKSESLQPLAIVMKEALYFWTKHQIIGGHQISYDQMQRIYNQLEQHPNHQMWQMNIGNGYNFERYGKALRVTRDDTNATHSATTTRICETALTSSVGTTSFKDLGCRHSWIEIHSCVMGKNDIPYQFIQTTLGIYQGVAYGTFNNSDSLKVQGMSLPSISFTPPWKKSSVPVQMNAFLRGQDVPLHERPNVSIILRVLPDAKRASATASVKCDKNVVAITDVLLTIATSSSTTVVAVYIPAKQKWIIDQQFKIQKGEYSSNEDVDASDLLSISVEHL